MHARNYSALAEAGTLTIEYGGEKLDMNAIAIIQINLQIIAEKVVADMENLMIRNDQRTAYSPGIIGEFEYSLNPVIRLVPTEIRVGSLFESVIPFIPIVADPDVRAALQGVLGNIIFSIANAGFRRYFNTKTTGQISQSNNSQADVGPNVAAIAVALAQHGPHSIKIRHQSSDGSLTEVEITPAQK